MLRHTLRSLLHAPAVTVPVVLTIAVAIGLVTAMFSLVNGYAWRELPYADAHRIAAIGAQVSRRPDLLEVEPGDRARLAALPEFQNVAAYRTEYSTVRHGDTSVRDRVLRVDPEFFPLLRISPARGRVFAASETDAVVLSHATWSARFGADTAAIGRILYMGGRPYTIAGILPEGFDFANAAVFAPFVKPEPASVLARLADGVGVERARARLEAIPVDPERYDEGVRLALNADMAQRAAIGGPAAMLLVLFFTASGFVVLIACANVAALLLARAVARRADYSVRAALGASRRRLVVESIVESGTLAACAALLGLLLSAWTLDLLVAALPVPLFSWLDFGTDWRVFAFAAGAAVLCILATGWLPARESARIDLQLALRSAADAGQTRQHARFLRILVGSEIALAFALFASTALLARSAIRLADIDLGYDTESVVAFDASPGSAGFTRMRMHDYSDRLVRALRAVPGAENVAWLGDFAGFRSPADTTAFEARRPVLIAASGDVVRGLELAVAAGNPAATLGLPLVAGRTFNAADQEAAAPVAMLTDEAARLLFGDDRPVGRSFRLDTIDVVMVTVVGIVKSPRVLRQNMTAGYSTTPRALVMLPVTQASSTSITGYVRTAVPEASLRAVASAARLIDAAVAIENVSTLHHRVADRIELRVFGGALGAISIVALGLALLGLYGIVAYSTERRIREIGVRMALGATPRRIAAELVRGVSTTLAAGLVGGCLLALVLSRVLRVFLFAVSPLDPVSYAAAILAFAIVALAALLVPARRVLRVDPVEVLRG